jgi:predicted RNA binding protein YcfA (HicA-like mRNA interferase family)
LLQYILAAGWVLDRINGSHHMMTNGVITVPVHGNRDLGAGMLAAITRQTGIKLK